MSALLVVPAAGDIAGLEEVARRIRVEVVRTISTVRVGHIGGSLSEADILAALYFSVMRIRPDEPAWPGRDRFALSKGHASVGLYAALALRGYFPVEELLTFDQTGTRLQGHPDMTRLPGIDMSTGSLGMGISAAVGMALAARLGRTGSRTFALLGDGECQEGSVWEAAMVAARYGLDQLVAIVDHNKLQQFGWQGDTPEHRLPPEEPGELVRKWAAFGWRVLEIGRPVASIANTIKGRGLSFAEGEYLWHVKIPTAAEYAQALVELGEPAAEPEAKR